jgi:hypothetical protein
LRWRAGAGFVVAGFAPPVFAGRSPRSSFTRARESIFPCVEGCTSSDLSDLITGFGGAFVRSRFAGSARRTGALPADGVLIGFLLSLIVVKIWLTCVE